MIAATLALVLGLQGSDPTQGQDPEAQVSRGYYLKGPGGVGKPRLMVQTPEEPMLVYKISPQHKWEFPFLTTGWAQPFKGERADDWALRLRVYHQRRRENNEPAPFVARALLRLWDYNYTVLGLDHKGSINKGIVDVYLCWGGDPGGQQRFDVETVGEFNRQVSVNTIYIYQLESFTDPVEMIRELAHEYGHASLPPVGGFKTPEDWANGYLGEKIYLRYLRDELRSKRLDPVDAMGATFAQLDPWVREHVDPLVARAAKEPPDPRKLRLIGPSGMNAYVGLALYMHALLPPDRFTRSIVTIGSTQAADYPAAVLGSVAEVDRLSYAIPTGLRGKPIWIPLAPKATLEGLKPLKRQGSWAQIKTSKAEVRVRNR